MDSKAGKIALHVIACAGFLSLPVIFSPDFDFSFRVLSTRSFLKDLVSYTLAIGYFYLNFYVLIPRLYFTKSYAKFAVVSLLCFIVIILIPFFLFPNEWDVINTQPLAPVPGHSHSDFFFKAQPGFFRFLLVFAVSLLIKTNNRLKQAEQEKMSAELSFLRAQINPHFLFNTLNSIYSLAITRSDKTAGSVVRLSEMMRYVTTEAHSEFVPLEKEIKYVTNYIELQQVRLGDTVKIDFQVNGTSRTKKIIPLVLMTFVENAFKYGVNPEEDSYIVIRIDDNDRDIVLDIRNRKVQTDYSKEYHSGQGIENTRQRLLMSYPGSHILEIRDKDEEYSVHLQIQLS
ncbi:MAG TPA: sensor histidine kinase [Bacteroidia bacterium]|nr:sensor histidine kinase [Bacteroidia bacterium]